MQVDLDRMEGISMPMLKKGDVKPENDQLTEGGNSSCDIVVKSIIFLV